MNNISIIFNIYAFYSFLLLLNHISYYYQIIIHIFIYSIIKYLFLQINGISVISSVFIDLSIL